MILQSMFNQRERSLDSLLIEVRQLKERIKVIFPSYTASLKEVSQIPEEFERRFWASCLDALAQKITDEYHEYEAQARMVDRASKLITLGMNFARWTGGIEPMPPPDSFRVAVSIYPSGKIEPALLDDPNKQPDSVITTFEKFMTIAQRLKEDLLKGTITLTSEAEIPELIYKLAVKSSYNF